MGAPDEMTMTVIGAGMAGLTFSALMHRSGIEVPVLEKARSLDEIGAGVQLTPRTVSLLDRLGMREELLAVGVEPQAREIRAWNGDPLVRTELGNWCSERYGTPYLTIHRADLQRALMRQVPRIHVGSRVLHVSDGPEGAVAELADGRVHRPDVLIGADGIRSTTRAVLTQDRPVHSGLAAYRGLVPMSALPPEQRLPLIRIWVGERSHAVVYPVRRGELLNVVAITPGTSRGESWVSDGDVSALLSAYLGWDRDLTTILAQVNATTAWGLYDRDVLPRLAGSSVALIGDAGHPMLPFAAQGVNQAIEDAWVLAHCLLAPDLGDVTERLGRYSRLRAPVAARVQTMSRRMMSTLHVPDGADRELRDAQLAQDAELARHDALIAPADWSEFDS